MKKNYNLYLFLFFCVGVELGTREERGKKTLRRKSML